MKTDVTNRCGKRRGCYVTILTKDSDVRIINGRIGKVNRTLLVRGNDILEVDNIAQLPMDKELEKERQMEKIFP